ncbi:copper chaperone PCu(A)C [Streptomyces spinoverrucosus]|uniref:copper chaperone PCu(A)C n=1 Tax=Streptomyces spinoverrucosus TaxID=284043 RepID=UPI0018C3669E|nr:copper chaperone PCu(A)C [Streptomyces spinoverrucosus]MBG0854322.1 copper chaperone PCu(A)C [Streptomyces spinoverrucosus]
MSSSLRRGALAASAIAFSIASLAACGAGNNSQTLEIKPDNAATSVGDIKIQNAVVITQADPAATGPAAVSATVFNSSDRAQTLESISLDGAQQVKLSPASGKGELSIPAGGSVVIGGKGNASAVLENAESLTDGDAHKVTFSFSQTGDVSLEAFIVPAEGFYAAWGPSGSPAASPSPTGSPTASPTGEADGEHGEGATGTPADQASGSATGSAEGDTAGH